MIRTRLLMAEGNCDEALRTAVATSRMGRRCDGVPLLCGKLVVLTISGCAIDDANRVLQAGAVSRKVRCSGWELALQERMEGYTQLIKGERAFGLESFRHYPSRNFWLFSRGRWNQWESEYLDAMQAFLTLPGDRRPYSETIKTIHGIEAEISPNKGMVALQVAPE